MHWFALLAMGAIANKLVARYRRGAEVPLILEDPANVRTLARFELHDGSSVRDLLASIASALGIDGWVIEDGVVRAPRAGSAREVDVLRLVPRGGALYTLELARTWTGAELGAPTRAMLIRIHGVLSRDPGVRALGWHWRQDRALAVPHLLPVPA